MSKWNLIIAAVATAFVGLVALVVLSAIWGDNATLQDDAIFLTAVGAIMALLLQQVHHGDVIKRTEQKIDRVYEHVNNVEEQEAIPDDNEPERPTLGSLLRKVDRKVDDHRSETQAGFRVNDEVHDVLREGIGAVREALHAQNGRHDDIVRRVDALDHPTGAPPPGTSVPPARPPSKRRKP